jgi:hypothetical protein
LVCHPGVASTGVTPFITCVTNHHTHHHGQGYKVFKNVCKILIIIHRHQGQQYKFLKSSANHLLIIIIGQGCNFSQASANHHNHKNGQGFKKET